MTDLNIPDSDLADWLGVLKPYQRKTIETFLQDLSPQEAAKKWLSTTGSPNIVPFGGTADTKPFWDRFLVEFKRFVCDEAAYSKERKALAQQGTVSKEILISAVSAAIGATIGYAATLLAPAVAILLYTTAKIGIAAYCKNEVLPNKPASS